MRIDTLPATGTVADPDTALGVRAGAVRRASAAAILREVTARLDALERGAEGAVMCADGSPFTLAMGGFLRPVEE
jgi:hypothetical protein